MTNKKTQNKLPSPGACEGRGAGGEGGQGGTLLSNRDLFHTSFRQTNNQISSTARTLTPNPSPLASSGRGELALCVIHD